MKTTARKSKAIQKAGNPFPRLLEREEWFFGRVPEDEIVSCFYYEYARSREDICRLVYSWQQKLADLGKAYEAANTPEARAEREGWWDHTFTDVKTATNAFWQELMQLTDSTCSHLLVNLPEFPDVPWQKVPESKRAELKGLLTYTRDRYPGILGGLRQVTIENNMNVKFYDHIHTNLKKMAAFSIDWNGGVEKVISDFKKWARKQYSELDLPRKKKPRDTYYESLKQLGVLRLKEKLGSWRAVQNYTRKALGSEFGKLYGDDHALWRKARLAATKRIQNMFPISFPTSLTH